jgi:hypothetical protein
MHLSLPYQLMIGSLNPLWCVLARFACALSAGYFRMFGANIRRVSRRWQQRLGSCFSRMVTVERCSIKKTQTSKNGYSRVCNPGNLVRFFSAH